MDIDTQWQSDSDLVELSLQDSSYFGVLIERYEVKLTRYIRRITYASYDDTQDILQDIFIKTYKNLAGFNTSLSFNSWIYRIAHNTVVDHARKIQTSQKHGVTDQDDEVFHWTADNKNFLQELELQEFQGEIQSVIRDLPLKYREVLELKFLEGLSYREISDIVQKPEGTVATLINRAKKAFKESYENYQR